MKAIFRFVVALLCGAGVFFQASAQGNINVNNATSACGTSAPGTCAVSGNQVDFSISAPTTNPLTSPMNPRFEAFWIMGDGNYIEFIGNDVASDADSRNMPADYFYLSPEAGAQYTATAYLTGKYTNTTPPPEYRRTVTLGARGAGSSFNARLAPGERMDIHSNHYRYTDPYGQTGHLVRRGNFTAFMISYPRSLFGKLYFFYNGQKRSISPLNITKCTTDVLTFYRTDTPKYFEGFTTATPNPTSTLAAPYTALFAGEMSRKYKDFVVYSSEDVSAGSMPENFTEKRQFPILKAVPEAVLATEDGVLSVFAILTGSQPLDSIKNASEFQKVSNVLSAMGLGNASMPIAAVAGNGTEYAIAASEATVYYVSGFDPNQLIVEDIKPLDDEHYQVTFRLDICNEGQDLIKKQNVSIRYPDGAFWDFQYLGEKPDGSGGTYNYDFVSNEGGLWKFNLEMLLIEPPVPRAGDPHQEVCEPLYFTALTDCNGVRSLWRENGGKVMEACVVFPEALGQPLHCNYNSPIGSDQFKDGGNCICCIEKPCPKDTFCNWQYCLLLLLVLFLILLWLVKSKYIPWLSKLFS